MDAAQLNTLVETLGTSITSALRPLAAVEARARDQPRARPQAPIKADIRCPTFDGMAEVEGFIAHFHGVARLAEWNDEVVYLQLQAALMGSAQDLSHGHSIEAILASLKLRYGMMPREDMSRLEALRKDTQTSLHVHSVHIERLYRIAYAELPAELRANMAKEKLWPLWAI